MTTMLYEKEWNEYLERKAHSEYVNSLLPDGSLLKTRDLTDEESSVYEKQLESESIDIGERLLMPKETKIVITTMTELPEYCYNCPCHDGEYDRCNADNERRTSIYRPFWCPLKELETDK